jgi:putative spermidine/putrescine transport system ATP-binding protein
MAAAAGIGQAVRGPAGPAAVSVRRVEMAYPDLKAVDDVSFELREGAFLTILGPSGSGKTTLLRMIAGFQTPTAGDIYIAGEPVRAVPPWRRSIGMVFQRLALFPHLTAAANVAFPLRMRRFDARTIHERVERYLELVRLGGLGGRRIHELSGGQQQRVAIARALVFEPDLLLLDEPLASLDRKLREEMQLEFRRIQRELGVTTINVTHDQREALIMSDEIIVMDKGRVQQMGGPSVTYRAPANPFVAGFIGVTNFLSGTVRGSDGGAVTLAVGDTLMAGRPGAGPVGAGIAVDAALRAEQIRIAGSAETLAGLATVLEGSVADVIFEGERVVYEVKLAPLGGMTLRVFDHDPQEHAGFAAGARVFLGWNERDLLVFAR